MNFYLKSKKNRILNIYNYFRLILNVIIVEKQKRKEQQIQEEENQKLDLINPS